jgi:hypothetical protein
MFYTLAYRFRAFWSETTWHTDSFSIDVKKLNKKTLSIMKFIIMTLSLKGLFTTLSKKELFATLSINDALQK